MEVGPAETSPQHVDDSVPLAFLLGKKFNYYMDPHLHTATLVEKNWPVEAVKQEAQNARLKQQWRMIHAQRIQSIAMEQREYAQHLLSMMEHPRQANNTAK
ncbi:unnamed protein product [Aphanomyces euteiches]